MFDPNTVLMMIAKHVETGTGCVAAAPSRAIDERDVGYCIPSYRASQPTPTTTTKYQHKYKCMHETNIGSVYLCI